GAGHGAVGSAGVQAVRQQSGCGAVYRPQRFRGPEHAARCSAEAEHRGEDDRLPFVIFLAQSSFPQKREFGRLLCMLPWIPAFAGMTKNEKLRSVGQNSTGMHPVPPSTLFTLDLSYRFASATPGSEQITHCPGSPPSRV